MPDELLDAARAKAVAKFNADTDAVAVAIVEGPMPVGDDYRFVVLISDGRDRSEVRDFFVDGSTAHTGDVDLHDLAAVERAIERRAGSRDRESDVFADFVTLAAETKIWLTALALQD